MDSHQIQFILKTMMGFALAALIGLSVLIPSANATPIQNSNGQVQQKQSQSAFVPVQEPYQQQYQQYSQGEKDEGYKTLQSSPFITNYQQLTKDGMEIVNIRPTRRTILSTIMAPFMSMREQAMNMLSATMQGCGSGNQTMWCRFWGMFLRK